MDSFGFSVVIRNDICGVLHPQQTLWRWLSIWQVWQSIQVGTTPIKAPHNHALTYLCYCSLWLASVPPEKEWRNNLREEAAWPGMAAGFASCLLAITLIADNLIGVNTLLADKQAIRAYGRSLLLFCVATCLTFVCAIAMTVKDIVDMTGHVDSSYYTEDVECSPNQVWYLALGSAMFGFLSCVLTCCLVDFQFLRNEDKGLLPPPLEDMEARDSSTETIRSVSRKKVLKRTRQLKESL